MTTEKNKRYDRQMLIDDWDQQTLSRATVTIIGSGNLAKYTALPLAALGVGNIRIIDSAEGSKEDMLLDLSLEGKVKVKALEKALKIINPEINVIGIDSELSSVSSYYFLEGSDVIIDATNSKVSKSHAFGFHHNIHNTPLISASADREKGKIVPSSIADLVGSSAFLMPMFDGKEQGDLVSIELGGVIAEEVKKCLMKKEDYLRIIYNYNLESDKLFSFVSDRRVKEHREFNDKKILIVGAGALGCFLGPAIISNLKPARLDVMDFDKVEEHNLNRQVCFYDAVGMPKAERLAETLRRMSRNGTEINALVDKFTEDLERKVEYDLIFDAVDSFFTKAILHNHSKRNGVPLISGGTDYRAATVLTYQPEKTSCFDCQINLSRLAIKSEIIRRTSCLQAPDPSVIMTNQVAGALMVGEARKVFRPEIYGSPINGEIKYISDLETRGGISNLRNICSCYKNGVELLELPEPERVKVEEIKENGRTVKRIFLDGAEL
ncbi:ThiF family adenylyltransferase [Candidatus Pacearchaeota archaeon]|nr:ThiF family adenylyltransferase [Candidatus Pacearchaeota archaeon]